jgi:hypothetical protein
MREVNGEVRTPGKYHSNKLSRTKYTWQGLRKPADHHTTVIDLKGLVAIARECGILAKFRATILPSCLVPVTLVLPYMRRTTWLDGS